MKIPKILYLFTFTVTIQDRLKGLMYDYMNITLKVIIKSKYEGNKIHVLLHIFFY